MEEARTRKVEKKSRKSEGWIIWGARRAYLLHPADGRLVEPFGEHFSSRISEGERNLLPERRSEEELEGRVNTATGGLLNLEEPQLGEVEGGRRRITASLKGLLCFCGFEIQTSLYGPHIILNYVFTPDCLRPEAKRAGLPGRIFYRWEWANC